MLELKKISCKRNNDIIFKDLSLNLEASDTLIVNGQNGAGKSSLLRIISGNLDFHSGEIFWKKKSIKHDAEDFKSNLGKISSEVVVAVAILI